MDSVSLEVESYGLVKNRFLVLIKRHAINKSIDDYLME